MNSVDPKDRTMPEMEQRAKALGIIHYHQLRARRISFVLGPATVIAGIAGTILWSWLAIPIVVVIYFIYGSILSQRTIKLIEAQTGLSTLEQWELFHNPDPLFGNSSNDSD